MKITFMLICIALVSCDTEPVRYGTVLEVNETGVRVEWEDGTVESRRIIGAAFKGDDVCLHRKGAWIGGCQILVE